MKRDKRGKERDKENKKMEETGQIKKAGRKRTKEKEGR